MTSSIERPSVLNRGPNKRKFGPKILQSINNEYLMNSRITAWLRYDDECGNGHNTLSVTGTIKEDGREVAGGCLHDEIAAAFPGLIPAITFHLCSTAGPMHYVANSIYHLGIGQYSEFNADHFRSTALWGLIPGLDDAEDPEQLRVWPRERVAERLLGRLPHILNRFQEVVTSYGFEY